VGTIVCAVDDSPEAEEALRVAAGLSVDAGLRLVVAHVEERTGDRWDCRLAGEKRGRELLERLLARQGFDGEVDRRVEVGKRASELARVAFEEAASVLVLGCGGGRWWWRRRASRLACELTAIATCPVVVVPPAARR
jgi:nucleotide-binding universal stress UspA family protein